MGTVTPLRRDAARSREALLAAAVALFAERGFDRTTLRDVGDRAGVDPALVARYFGSKTALYLAALRSELGDDVPADLLERSRTSALLARAEQRGPGPVFQAAVRVHEDEQVQDATREVLQARIVAPLRDRFCAQGLSQPDLRAQVAAAAFVGVVLARSAGTLEALSAADDVELEELVHDLLAGLLAP
jgi:AcrR family transcriptional regulator